MPHDCQLENTDLEVKIALVKGVHYPSLRLVGRCPRSTLLGYSTGCDHRGFTEGFAHSGKMLILMHTYFVSRLRVASDEVANTHDIDRFNARGHMMVGQCLANARSR